MISHFSSNVILAKVRAMYGRRIKTEDYEALVNCKNVSEIISYLKSNTCYSELLVNVNENQINRSVLEDIIRKKSFYDLESLGRYELTTGDLFCEYVLIRMEIEEIMRAMAFMLSGSDVEYIVPKFLSMHTKIDLVRMAKATNYDDFLDSVSKSVYQKILRAFRPAPEEHINLIAIENALYTFLYEKVFQTISRGLKGKVKKELEKFLKEYIDFNNLARIIRLKQNNTTEKLAILDFGSLPKKKMDEMLAQKKGREVLALAKNTKIGKKLEKIEYDYIDEIPLKFVYKEASTKIWMSTNASVVMLSYVFLTQVELQNIINIIEAVRYGLEKEDVKKLLILKTL